jgi:2-iminobutanoate/2-iminopropanoate deaminase
MKKTNSPLPFSTLREYNGLVFLSGVTAADLTTGEVKGDAAEQTRTALENIKGILNNADMDLGNILKATVYLKDIASFGEVNAVYSEILPEPFPARTCIEIAAIPMGALVEIDVICGR